MCGVWFIVHIAPILTYKWLGKLWTQTSNQWKQSMKAINESNQWKQSMKTINESNQWKQSMKAIKHVSRVSEVS